jgi:hypothetical protein
VPQDSWTGLADCRAVSSGLAMLPARLAVSDDLQGDLVQERSARKALNLISTFCLAFAVLPSYGSSQ